MLSATYRDQRFSPHANETFVIGTNVRGYASCFGSEDQVFGPGVITVVPPGEVHDGLRVGRASWKYLAMYPSRAMLRDLLQETTGRGGAEPVFARRFYPDPEVVRAFVQAHWLCFSDAEPLLGESAMVEALGLLLSRYGRSTSSRSPEDLPRSRRAVRRSLDLMQDRLSEPLTLSELAAAARYSRFHFLRLFKAETGQTPAAYLMRVRVEGAKGRLRRGSSIADTAFATGFSDQAHLSRRFKQFVGVTPGEFVQGSRSTVGK